MYQRISLQTWALDATVQRCHWWGLGSGH